MEGKKEGNEDRIEELSDQDEVVEEGQGDSGAQGEEESETENEERDADLNKEERGKR